MQAIRENGFLRFKTALRQKVGLWCKGIKHSGVGETCVKTEKAGAEV